MFLSNNDKFKDVQHGWKNNGIILITTLFISVFVKLEETDFLGYNKERKSGWKRGKRSSLAVFGFEVFHPFLVWYSWYFANISVPNQSAIIIVFTPPMFENVET